MLKFDTGISHAHSQGSQIEQKRNDNDHRPIKIQVLKAKSIDNAQLVPLKDGDDGSYICHLEDIDIENGKFHVSWILLL